MFLVVNRIIEAQRLAIRLAVGTSLAVITTTGLFFLMQALVTSGDTNLEKAKSYKLGDIIMPPEVIETVKELKKPEKNDVPPPPEAPPPEFDTPPPEAIAISAIAPANPALSSGVGLFRDGDQIPLVKVQPIYPNRAAERGIEGYVVMSFIIDETGAVIPDSITVVEANPKNVFEYSAKRALSKWKYKPRVVDGKGVLSEGQARITFNLEQ